MKVRGRVPLVVGVALSAACAGAPPPPSSAPAPPSAAAEPAAVAPPPPPPPPAATVAAPAPAEALAPAMAPPGERQNRSVAMSRARADVNAASRMLESAGSNCVVACKALGSMDRSTGQLCLLVASPDDVRVCETSKASVVVARERVRASCGTCPGGVVVDPSAPVPSP